MILHIVLFPRQFYIEHDRTEVLRCGNNHCVSQAVG